jgi:hypothetical protein
VVHTESTVATLATMVGERRLHTVAGITLMQEDSLGDPNLLVIEINTILVFNRCLSLQRSVCYHLS